MKTESGFLHPGPGEVTREVTGLICRTSCRAALWVLKQVALLMCGWVHYDWWTVNILHVVPKKALLAKLKKKKIDSWSERNPWTFQFHSLKMIFEHYNRRQNFYLVIYFHVVLNLAKPSRVDWPSSWEAVIWLVGDSLFAWYVLVTCKHQDQRHLSGNVYWLAPFILTKSEVQQGHIWIKELQAYQLSDMTHPTFKPQWNLVEMNVPGSW